MLPFAMPELKEGIDYTIDPQSGLLVFTFAYLKARGRCCESGCQNCPWGFEKGGSDEAPADLGKK